GFVYTDQNNWLTMNTSAGSGAMTDMGLNVSSRLTEKLRVGAQVYDCNLGKIGRWHPSLDWAVVDYRFTNWLGVRAEKSKRRLASIGGNPILAEAAEKAVRQWIYSAWPSRTKTEVTIAF